MYCSATGASEPRNMAYMSRLGIWGPGTQFNDFHDFIRAVERRGVGAMEIVAMDMKVLYCLIDTINMLKLTRTKIMHKLVVQKNYKTS